MQRRNFFLVVLVIISLILLAVSNYNRAERQKAQDAEWELKKKANPWLFVKDGMAVEEVEKVFGKGEHQVDDGEDFLLWYGAGNNPWTLIVTVKDGRVWRPGGIYGRADKNAAISVYRQGRRDKAP
jgi:hypothetical protein